MADFLALMGDAVDNIPGVPGVGRKTAQTLLKHFHTLDGVLDSIDQIARLKFRNATFVAESLRERGATALLSRRLTAIACDMPLPISRMSELRLQPPDLAMLDTFCETQNFGRLLRDRADDCIHGTRPESMSAGARMRMTAAVAISTWLSRVVDVNLQRLPQQKSAAAAFIVAYAGAVRVATPSSNLQRRTRCPRSKPKRKGCRRWPRPAPCACRGACRWEKPAVRAARARMAGFPASDRERRRAAGTAR